MRNTAIGENGSIKGYPPKKDHKDNGERDIMLKKTYLGLYAAYLTIAYCLFVSGNVSTLSQSAVFVACILSALCPLVLLRKDARVRLCKYKSKGRICAIACICIYASLASFGYQLFSLSDSRMHIEAIDLLYLLMGGSWYVPVVLSVLYCLETLNARVNNWAERKTQYIRRKVYICLFLVLAFVQLIIACAFWPGGFPNDTVWTLRQVEGIEGYSDWHPVFYTLTMQWILSIIPNHGVLALVQMLLFAWIVTDLLMILFDRGVSLRALVIGGIIFLALPNQVFSGIGIVKDYPFTLALLWGTLLLFKLGIEEARSKKLGFLIQLFLDQFFILAYRHNGIIPAAFILVACMIWGIRAVKNKRLFVIIPSAVAVIAFAVFKGPVFDKLQVYHNTSSPYVTMLCAVGSVVNKDLPLSEEANDILEEVMPLEDWAQYYTRYQGHDQYVWGSPSGFNTSGITITKAFRIYLEALIKYPDVVLKDRLDGMNILWCIQQPDDSFNTRYFDSVYRFEYTAELIDVEGLEYDSNEWIGYINRSPIAEFYRSHDASDHTSVLHMIFWRSGLYILFLLICMLYWAANRMNHMWLAAVPLFGNLFVSILIVYHQSFRYVYFVQLLTVALALLSVVTKCSSETNESIKEAVE